MRILGQHVLKGLHRNVRSDNEKCVCRRTKGCSVKRPDMFYFVQNYGEFQTLAAVGESYSREQMAVTNHAKGKISVLGKARAARGLGAL